MQTDKIENALLSALSLLKEEVKNIEYIELKNEYNLVIDKIKIALNEIEKNDKNCNCIQTN
jgi:hypothetical protein